jgi:hypothetical protein
MPMVVNSGLLKQYVPKWAAGKREPDRAFLWTLIKNLEPALAKDLLEKALEARAARHRNFV